MTEPPARGMGARSPARAMPGTAPLTAPFTAPDPRVRRRPIAGLAIRPTLPPQHGAWAFLMVPVLCGFAIAGTSAAGAVFLMTWLAAYPTGYYAGRALTTRVRRGSWTRMARREAGRAAPWGIVTAMLGGFLAVGRPWLVPVALALIALWAAGLVVAARLGERSMTNDLVLVAEALIGLPLTVAVVAGPGSMVGPLAQPTGTTALLLACYLIGSVIHVKSLLREAGKAHWHALDIGWHALAAATCVVASPAWLVGFLPALMRAVVMRPGLRPAQIGGVEVAVAVLMVVSAFVAA